MIIIVLGFIVLLDIGEGVEGGHGAVEVLSSRRCDPRMVSRTVAPSSRTTRTAGPSRRRSRLCRAHSRRSRITPLRKARSWCDDTDAAANDEDEDEDEEDEAAP